MGQIEGEFCLKGRNRGVKVRFRRTNEKEISLSGLHGAGQTRRKHYALNRPDDTLAECQRAIISA